MRWTASVLAVAVVACGTTAWTEEPAPLVLEARIPLGDVKGRIDHLAFDPGRERLFVAELGNDSVGVVDIAAGKVIHRIAGLAEPQGVGYLSSSDTLSVANAGDGSLRLYHGADYAPAGRIDLADDADNIRVDDGANRIYVGYGSGALAVLDPASSAKIADIPLEAHPEGFQLDPTGPRIYVNVPKAREIAVLDRISLRQIAAWRQTSLGSNFPMALDGHRLLVVFRSPATLLALAEPDGAVTARADTCGDADDVFVDAKRRRIYVSCGEGFLDVFAAQGGAYERIGHIRTAPGARTAFFAPALDRFFLAVRASASEPAAVWLFRPAP